ncbi:MAG: PD-(D/E)XK nuclease family protein [Bacteroidales bacterium]|nr:PD-(D/E)XK nuclease family protein [Bacteroidales bacterium]
MVPFLRQVAAHYFQGPDIEKTCFVFPNRRSLVFFKKYLGDLVRENGSGHPILLPPLYTINDFFARLSGVTVTDKLPLLLELYKVYKSLNPQAEPLDDFIFWGDAMLADFDDVDKFLADAGSLMRNVQELKAIQDNMSYLTTNQQEAINQFLGHFRDGKTDPVKYRFLGLWNILYPVYRDFNAALSEKGMAYEGRMYRLLADKLKAGTSVADVLRPVFPETEKFVFVGLNALNACEHLLLKRMRDAQLADFVWDYVSDAIRDGKNKSSFFMKQNLEEFPQAFPVSGGSGKPEITVISVPSSVGQAKLAPQILADATPGNPEETAFVLPDESLLLPLLNSLPPEQESVNVTMGLPMSGSAVFCLLKAVGALQLRIRKKGDDWFFYHRTVREVLSSGLVKKLSTEEDAACIRKIKADAKYYIPLQDLQGGPLLKLIFRVVCTSPAEASAAANHRMEQYLLDLLSYIGAHLSAGGDMLLELDFAKRCHTQLTLLQDTDLEVLPATHLRLLERLLESISVPFRGEPLEGLQVMGPLETRALDFRNLIILSANEGMFPRRSANASFIPPELRKAFGLPTYEYQDAVWAYYFYRMIQRPEKVWILYDSRTEGLKSGEESRYVKQLEYLFSAQVNLSRRVAVTFLQPVSPPEPIVKTEEHVAVVRNKELSASILKNYLDCPAKFYYQAVEGLEEEEEVAEAMDSGMFGNAFHKVMQHLYDGLAMVTRADIEAWRKDRTRLKKMVREEVLAQMHSFEVTGRNLVLEGVILDYVLRTLNHDARLLEASGSEGFRIIGLEKPCRMEWNGYRFKGFIDRIDSYRPGQVRIVDYKTGRVEDSEILITDESAAKVAEKLFGPENDKRPKIALQLFIYDELARRDLGIREPLVNAIYSTGRLYGEAAPESPESAEFGRLATEGLQNLLAEITDPSVPWERKGDNKTCSWCPFKSLCGR